MRSCGRLAVSALAPDVAGQHLEAVQATSHADLIEFRLDRLRRSDGIEPLLERSPLPCIATCRRPRDGGAFRAGEQHRRALLQRASEKADWVDIELDVLADWRPSGPARLIVSHHDFDGFPAIAALLERLLAQGGIAKLAVRTETLAQVLELMARQRAHPGSILIGMGALGSLSRISAAANGAFLTFGAGAAASGPGQIAAQIMRTDYRVGTGPAAPWSLVGVLPPLHDQIPELNAALAGEQAARLVLPLPELPADAQLARRAGFELVAAGPQRLLLPEGQTWRQLPFSRRALLRGALT